MGDNKKMAVMGISSLILVAMVVAVAVGVSRKQSQGGGAPESGGEAQIQTSSKAITQICQPTDYKEACINSLSEAADKNATDPKQLIQIAFKAAMEKTKKAVGESELIKEAGKDPRTSQALENCKKLMEYSMDDLQASIDKLGEFDLSKVDDFIDDIKIWLSGSLTYQDTCLDGFEDAQGDTGEKMKQILKGAGELTSNALAIIDQISSVLSKFNLSFLNRRLLTSEDSDDQEPEWFTDKRRGLLDQSVADLKPNVVVAKDGSGQFKTIQEALATVPLKKNDTYYVIHVKEGVYQEYLTIGKSMLNVMLIGDGPTKTKITGNKNFIDGTNTFMTSTVAVLGDGFIGKNIGFENSAGAVKHQAVAVRVQSDRSIFFNCQFDGYQDTLYAHTHRQFYRECTISGTIDFIFGNSASFFQNCKILVRKPMDNQKNIVAAQGRKDRREPTAIILHNCTISGDPAYLPVKDKIPSYLARPWKDFSRTFILQSQIDDIIDPSGWLPWQGDLYLNTLFFSEWDNRGPGAATDKRMAWEGIKKLNGDNLQQFTAQAFLQGDKWIKGTGIPYTPGLLPPGSAAQ